MQEPREVRIVAKPLSSVLGMKSRFMGLHGEPCSVEQLALQASPGFGLGLLSRIGTRWCRPGGCCHS